MAGWDHPSDSSSLYTCSIWFVSISFLSLLTNFTIFGESTYLRHLYLPSQFARRTSKTDSFFSVFQDREAVTKIAPAQIIIAPSRIRRFNLSKLRKNIQENVTAKRGVVQTKGATVERGPCFSAANNARCPNAANPPLTIKYQKDWWLNLSLSEGERNGYQQIITRSAPSPETVSPRLRLGNMWIAILRRAVAIEKATRDPIPNMK